MDGLALIEAFGDFKEDKNISKIDLMAIIEDSLKTLLRKRFDSDDHFDVIVNPDKGDFQIFLNKTIVADEMSEDDDLEKWLSRLIYYTIEAMFSDPIYGGNTHELGWTSTLHTTGNPRPMKKYGRKI